MVKGKVYIVGAGPGDESLATLGSLEAIKNSDVIVYDELANQALLRYAKKDAKLIYVGKKAGDHALPQEQMNELLADEAEKGNTVCRLKGGDPFLFGRGGEEAELLFQRKINFEIIPGITSAIAVPAYAGIPVTHRGLTSGVAIFTGHEDPTKAESDLNWNAIAKLGTTLVFLMGMKNIASITENLIKNGMDGKTPAAVIHRGTTNAQRVVTGTVADIVDVAERADIKAPSIIIIGKVVGMRDTLSWFEKRPLFGKEIIVTRTRKQASQLVDALQHLGALVHEFPTIEIERNAEALPKLDNAIRAIAEYDWVIFTSVNGVDAFFERIAELGYDSRVLGGVKACAIGSATAEGLLARGIKADLIPEKYVAESILEAFKGRAKGAKILLPRADIARAALPEGLEKEGATVDIIDIYRTVKPKESSKDELIELLKKADLVTFTSSSTVNNFAEILGDEVKSLAGKIKAASIGPVTTETINRYGFKLECEASEYTIAGLVDAIVNMVSLRA